VEDRPRARDEIFEIVRQRTRDVEKWRAALTRPELTLMVARNERGNPLACAGVVIDESVCLIVLANAISHEARWALHDYLVQILIAQRVRYLIASGGGLFGALGYPANVQHYQHLLGYELRHVSAGSPALRTGGGRYGFSGAVSARRRGKPPSSDCSIGASSSAKAAVLNPGSGMTRKPR
jgi:hypothetical protein